MNNHRLYTSDESAEHIWMYNQFEIRMNRQYRFIETTERKTCQYKENELLTGDFVLQKIRGINGEVENMRYIRSIKKHSIEDIFPPYVHSILNTKQLNIDGSRVLCSHN